jgi:hypothetical protein
MGPDDAFNGLYLYQRMIIFSYGRQSDVAVEQGIDAHECALTLYGGIVIA